MKISNLTNCFKALLAIVFTIVLGSENSGAQSYSISGTSPANQGQNYMYTMNGYPINTVTWQMYYGGTITSAYSNVCYVTWNVNTSGALGAIVDDGLGYTHQVTPIYVNINPSAPSTPPTPTIQSTNCGNTVLTRPDPLSGSGITYYWQSSSGGTSTSNSASTITQTSSGTQYLRAYNGVWSTSSSSKAYTVTQPTTWYGDGDDDGLGDPNVTTQACSQPVNYVNNANDTRPLSNENFVYTVAPRIETTDVSGLTNNQKIETVAYFDGLGRPMQNVAIMTGSNSQDIITHIGYDDYSRQDMEYLPYSSTSDIGLYRTGAMAETKSYYYNSSQYSTDFPGMTTTTINPYSEKHFEASPLNRVLEQGAPGKEWLVNKGSNTDRTIKFENKSNVSNEVRLFGVGLNFTNNTYIPLLTGGNSFYPANELYKTITKDENWSPTQIYAEDHTTEEFKDKQGRVILKRTYNDGVEHDTYYVYDEFGNLTYVLPPKASDLINPNGLESDLVSSQDISGSSQSLGATNSITLADGFRFTATTVNTMFTATIESDQPVLDELCYQYVYDDRNRLVEKKIPGKGWEHIIYNKLDQPILTQDANLREQNQWLFTKYDAFGRVAYTGLFSSQSSRTALQIAANAASAQYVSQETSYISLGGANVYYSGDNTVYPTSGITEIHTITYYDKYVDVGSGISDMSYGVTPITNAKGLPTVSKVRILDVSPAEWITTVTYYDNKSRPIYVYNHNGYLDTTDKLKSDYDFINLLETTTIHEKSTLNPITVVDTYTYDHANRLKTQKQKIGSEPEELIVLNEYDELGQLKAKKVGGAVNSTIENSNGLQEIEYAYNVRGWLKQINDPVNLGSKLFAFKINYNAKELNSSNDALYNGNISETIWKTANDVNGNKTRGYAYTYDALNRIMGANYGIKTTGSYNLLSGFDMGVGSYDKNGNIISLWRDNLSNTKIDQLTYTYYNGDDSNRLKKVEDSAAGTDGFKNGSSVPEEYTYDANGNMVIDANKGITAIIYNYLNLPDEIQFGSTNKIKYIYDATGVKLEKKVVDGVNPNKYTFYAGNYVYERIGDSGIGSLKFFSQPEGYVDTENGYDYVYQYKDHLGNIRLSYKNLGSTGSPNLQIQEENNYYPFGLEHKGYNKDNINSTNIALKRKFGGKELQDDNVGGSQMDWYDFGARNYDASLGRWMNLDPLAEKMYSQSTYNYAFNNPMLFVDPDGMFPIIIHVRSFVPTKSFVFYNQFAGDDRGFSTNNSAKSRLHQVTNYETDTGAYTHRAIGTFSYSHYGATGYSRAYVNDIGSASGSVNTHLYGSNAALLGVYTPGGFQSFDSSWATPDIDIYSHLNVEVSQLDGGDQLLNISGHIYGDAFPNAEAYVEDAKGNTIFLGVFATATSVQTGMFTHLPGENYNSMMRYLDISILTDSKGIFKGIQTSNKTISIEDWNASFESLSVKEFRQKYGDWYNQLFGTPSTDD